MKKYSRLRSPRLVALMASALLVPAQAAVGSPLVTTAGSGAIVFKAADPEAVERLIANRPNDFGGLYLDTQNNTLVVQVVSGPPAASAQQAVAALPRATVKMRGLLPSTTMRIDTVARSRATLEAIKDRITTDRAWAAAAGATLSEWYVDVFHNRVSAGVTTVTDAVRQAAAARFGNAVDLHFQPLAVPTSKRADSSPWKGGSQIYVNGHDCSSGFTVVNTATGNRAQLTAGHCGNVGDPVTQNGAWIGNITYKEFGDHTRDFALYSGSQYGSKVYTNQDTAVALTGVDTFLLVGSYNTCFSGGLMDDMNCASQITALGMCAAFDIPYNPRYTVCGLVKAIPIVTPVNLVYYGDSGGPVLRRTQPIGGGPWSYWAVGLIVGRSGDSQNSVYFHPINEVVPAGYQVAIG
jgi:hypothetical protein